MRKPGSEVILPVINMLAGMVACQTVGVTEAQVVGTFRRVTFSLVVFKVEIFQR